MTTTPPALIPQQLRLERRSASGGPRLSWAAGVPFVTTVPRGPRRLRAWQRRLRATAFLTDALAAVVCASACAVSLGLATPSILMATGLSALVWGAAVGTARGYDVRRLGAGPEEFQSLLRAAAWLMASTALVSYLGQAEIPRRVVLIALPSCALVSAFCRYGSRKVLHRQRLAGAASLRTLVVGDAASVGQVRATLEAERHFGYRIVGVCSNSETTEESPTLGAVADIPQVVIDHDIDVVLVAGGQLRGQALRRLSWALEHTSADLVVAPGLVEVASPRVVVRPTAGLSLLHVESSSSGRARRASKVVLDYSLGSLLLVLVSPLIVAAAAAVLLTSRGPAFYAHTRIGLDGLPFTMYKLRTMTVDADSQRDVLLTSSDRDGLMFKMHADPRVTPVGRVLRRLSIDELPQLLNVVLGDMSLVGPRPPLPSEAGQYLDDVHRRLRVKPGLTGLWQVSGRADLTWDESVRLDLRYVDNWSVSMDLLILWKTARAVVSGSGAY